MILTCPECATGYFVDDGKVGPEGRSVKCAACGARWRAMPEAPLELIKTDSLGAIGLEPISAPPVVDMTPITGADLPKAYRGKVQTTRKIREAAVSGVIWAGMAMVFAALVGSAVIFRVDVVRLWPRSATAYAAVGLPVNPVGLVIEQVKAEPTLKDGHAALSVTGVIRNVVDRAVTPPPVRINLFTPQGKRVGGQIALPGQAVIPAGQTRHFAIAVIDPPSSTGNLEIAFVLDGSVPVARAPAAPARPAAAPAAKAAPDLALRGSATPPPPEAPQVAEAAPQGDGDSPYPAPAPAPAGH